MKNAFILISMTFALSTEVSAQTKKESIKLKASIDSIRNGQDLKKDSRGLIDTGVTAADTMSATPSTPTPSTPNNPNLQDPQPSEVHPNPPARPVQPNPQQGQPVGPGQQLRLPERRD